MSRYVKEDFKYLTNSCTCWEQLSGKKVFITGGTGLIGGLIIRFLDYLNKEKDLNIDIIALVRDEQKAKKRLVSCDVKFVTGDIKEHLIVNYDIDFMIHCAAITNSKQMVTIPADVSTGIVEGTLNILQLAHEKKIKSMVYLSSMEVYGQTSADLDYISEKDLGYIDLLNTRSCYPMGKRMAESFCHSFYIQYGIPVKIARLAQTFGAGVSKNESRVYAQFAKSAINETDIILHTDGASMGNYVYTADAIKGIFTLLLNGENGEAYNIANDSASMTIRQMAGLVAEKVACGSISVILDIPENNEYGYPAATKMKLCSDKITALGWTPTYGLDDMYRRMIGDWQENV